MKYFNRKWKSSSTRRMWIEIKYTPNRTIITACHPPHGGCGLKFVSFGLSKSSQKSSSTRRMWIEIYATSLDKARVDGHPPHGGCGLKCFLSDQKRIRITSSSTRRMWIEIVRRSFYPSKERVILHTEEVTRNMSVHLLL